MANAAFDLIGLNQLRNDPEFAGIDGSGVSVAIIDTGLDRDHPFLNSNYLTGVDFVYGGDNPIDNFGHGTHVSGTIGANNEDIGVAPDVGLIGLQVFQGEGASNPTIESALQWVLAHQDEYNIVAVNMSLGSGFYTSKSEAIAAGDILNDDIEQLEQAGVTVVSAAGNSYKDNEYENFGAPAILSTLAVGAVWQDGTTTNGQWGSGAIDYTTGTDRVVSFSQRLDADNTIFAPGALINSTVPGGGLDEMAGTSMASPHVAGAVALMQEAALQFGGRLLSPDEVVDIMISTADEIFDGDDEDDNVNNSNISYPRLNIYKAITEIKNEFDDVGGGDNGGDPNGTIDGAFIGPTLDGSPVNPILGSIGIDGVSTDIGTKDVDIYRFELVSPGNVSITVGSDTNNPADFNSLLRVFDESGNQLAIDDNSGEDDFSSLNLSFDPGVYYVGVSGANNDNYNPNTPESGSDGQIGNYALQFSLANDDPNGLISGAKSVNLEIGKDGEPSFIEGLIGSDYGDPVGVADVDLFKITIPDNGTLSVDIDTPYDTDYADTFVRLFDEQGNQLFFTDDSPVTNDNGLSFDKEGNFTEFTDDFYPGLVFEDPIDRSFYYGHDIDSFMSANVNQGGVYYIGVSDYFNQDYDPNNLDNRPAIGTGGQYDLYISFVNNDQNGSIPQAVSDISLPLVNQIGRIGTDAGSEVGDRDVDFFKINSASEGILQIDVDSYSDSSITDPVDAVVLLFDDKGNLLSSNDNTDSFDPLLQFQIKANQDYYAAVTGYGNDNFDPFLLSSGSVGDTGDYVVNAQVLPLSDLSTLSNETIDNEGVKEVSLESTVFAELGKDDSLFVGASDIDIYRFVPENSGYISINVNTNESFSADTFLRFFNAQGQEIDFNDDKNSKTRGSFLQLKVKANTEYFIGVNGASNQAREYNPLTGENAAPGSQGLYTLTINQESSAINLVTGTSAADSLEGTKGKDQLLGKAGNDDLRGGKGKDSIKGGKGKDVLQGDIGKDVLTGGKGPDLFTFNSATEGTDKIKDFVSGEDLIVVSADGFTAGLEAGKKVSESQFVIGTSATTSSHRFIYDANNGNLFFDADGSNSQGEILLANLSGSPEISHNDILVS